MNEVARLMHQARGRLSLGLSALQAPGTPSEVAGGAAPLAHAMGLLDRLEREGFVRLNQDYPELLSTLQRALHQLQWSTQQNPALAAAVDHVAGALGLVFTVRAQPPPAEVAAEPQAGAPVAPRPGEVPLVERAIAAAKERPLPRVDRPAPARAPARAEQPAQRDPLTTEQRRVVESLGAASTDAAGLLHMDASLGANSPSNFYRGFDGDDVIEHGGLFVATYNVPDLDQRVAVRVAFPDGREFMAQGVVKWRRLSPPGGSHSPESPPGFGLRFEQVPPNARQLVESYVRNREPLFYDAG